MIESIKEFFRELFANRRNTAAVLILGIAVLAVLIGVKLVQNTQIFKSRAAALGAESGMYNTRNGPKTLAQMRTELKAAGWPENDLNRPPKEIYYLYQRNQSGKVFNCAINYGDLSNMPKAIITPAADGAMMITVTQNWDGANCNNWFPIVDLKNSTTGHTFGNVCNGKWERRFDQDAGSSPRSPDGTNWVSTPAPLFQVSTCYITAPSEPGQYKADVLISDRSDHACVGKFTTSCDFNLVPPLHAIDPYVGTATATCDANNVATLNWSASPSPAGRTLLAYWVRVNKAPGGSWAPSNLPPDQAVEGDRFINVNTNSTTVALTPGQYEDWTVQAVYTDSAFQNMIVAGGNEHLGAFSCPAGSGGPVGPSYTTTEFRISEDPNLGADPNAAGWDAVPQSLRFAYNPAGDNTIDYTLLARNCNNDPTCNPYPRGDHTIYALFIAHDDAGNIQRRIEKNTITLAKAPKIDSVDCSISSTGGGSVATIKGSNFGDSATPGKVTVSGNTVSSTNWTDTQVVANLTSQTGGTADVTLTTVDGLTAGPISCSIGKSQLNFDAALACKTPTPLTGANVELFELNNNLGVGSTASTTTKNSIFKQDAVSFGPDGHAQLSVPDLTEGKAYKLVISAQNLLTKVVQFTAGKGTTDLNDVTVGVGDIFPTDKGDCTVNTLDKNQMVKDWSLDKDVTKKADLNGDGRVNSIDYSCLLVNFNKSCDKP